MAGEISAAEALSKFEAERLRLAKLFDAYEKQEKEFAALMVKLSSMEAEVADRDRIIKSLKEVLESRDSKMREMEIEITGLRNDKASHDPRVNQLTTDLRLAQEKFARLYALAEELEEEVNLAKKAIEARDDWFRTHVNVFADLQRAVDDHQHMIGQLDRIGSVGEAELTKLKK